MKRNTANDIESIPPGMIRADDARDMLTLLSGDVIRSMRKLVDGADASPEYRAGLESALDRAEAKAADIIDKALAPKPDA